MEGSWFRLLSTVENPLGFHVWSRNIRLLPVKKWWQKGLNKDHEKPAQWILWLSLRTESREQVRKLSTWIWITKKGFSKKERYVFSWVFPLPPMVNLNPDGISAQHAAMVKSLVELRNMCRSVRQRQWHLETLRMRRVLCDGTSWSSRMFTWRNLL